MVDLVRNADTQKMLDANKTLATHALIAQVYATSVNEQPKIDFPALPELEKYEKDMNDGLLSAQNHANHYLDTIQPKIIENVVSIGNCYTILSKLPTILLEGSTVDQWLRALNDVKGVIIKYKDNSQKVVDLSVQLDAEMKKCTQVFKSTVNSINAATDGKAGLIEMYDAEIKKYEDLVQANITKIVFGALGVVVGVILVGVGSCSSAVTGGAAAGVIVAGVVLAGGAGVMLVTSAADIKAIQDEKSALIQAKDKIKPEVKLASAISTGYQSYAQKISNVKKEATSMRYSWELLISWVDKVIECLEDGSLKADEVRDKYRSAIDEKEVKSFTDSLNIIKKQMTGLDESIIRPNKGESVGEAVLDAANAAIQGKRSEGGYSPVVAKRYWKPDVP